MNRLLIAALGLASLIATDVNAGRRRHPVRVCNEMQPFAGTLNDATPTIEACIAATQLDGTTELLSGTYTLHSTIDLNRDVALSGPGTGPCQITDLNCTTFRPHPTLFHTNTGLLRVTTGSLVERIIFDGTKTTRSPSSVSACQQGEENNSYGMNVLVYSSNLMMQYNVFKNALCGTSLLIQGGPRSGITIYQNFFVENGVHNLQFLWSDGFTANDLIGSTIASNHFIDNTDVDLIFGGCTDCIIIGNTVNHTGPPEKGSFAALMLYKWTNTSGVYNNTLVDSNAIECSQNECGFGLHWSVQIHGTRRTSLPIR